MPPPFSGHSKKVQRLIRRLNTPTKVQRWLKSLDYNKAETMRTLPGVIKSGRAHCLEAALSAAAILEHHGPAQHRSGATGAGYPPLILDLESADLLDHTLFLYKHNGKYGAIGKSRDIGLDGRKLVFKTIRALVNSYIIPYIDHHATITGFGVLDLRTLKNQSWRASTKNVWYVEEALRNIPHQKVSLTKKTIRLWRNRYIDFKKKYPEKQPDYYPGRENWI